MTIEPFKPETDPIPVHPAFNFESRMKLPMLRNGYSTHSVHPRSRQLNYVEPMTDNPLALLCCFSFYPIFKPGTSEIRYGYR